jgi:hypothetical protein
VVQVEESFFLITVGLFAVEVLVSAVGNEHRAGIPSSLFKEQVFQATV